MDLGDQTGDENDFLLYFQIIDPLLIFSVTHTLLLKLLRVSVVEKESMSLHVKERGKNLSGNKECNLWSGKRITIIRTSEEGLPIWPLFCWCCALCTKAINHRTSHKRSDLKRKELRMISQQLRADKLWVPLIRTILHGPPFSAQGQLETPSFSYWFDASVLFDTRLQAETSTAGSNPFIRLKQSVIGGPRPQNPGPGCKDLAKLGKEEISHSHIKATTLHNSRKSH